MINEEITILKRDGTKEPLFIDKLITSIIKSGLNSDDAKTVAEDVMKKVLDTSIDKEIKSTQIKMIVYETLKLNTPYEAEVYNNFKK